MEQAESGRKSLGCSSKHEQPWIQQLLLHPTLAHGPSHCIQKALVRNTKKGTKIMHV